MKKIGMVLLMLTTFFLTSYMPDTNQSEKLEAKACPTGQYWNKDTGNCTKLSKNTKGLNAELETLSNGSDISQGGWARKFGRLMVEISVIVSYAAQVLALITVVYAAFLYTTSNGNIKQIHHGKMLLLYAFAGIFIASFALVIANILGGAVQ